MTKEQAESLREELLKVDLEPRVVKQSQADWLVEVVLPEGDAPVLFTSYNAAEKPPDPPPDASTRRRKLAV